MEIIWKYFPELSTQQRDQLAQLPDLYRYWNDKINVISRKDIAHIVEHHILHSMAVARITTFPTGRKILDIGTGGGFPGIPLAILFPQAHFTLVDSVGKKIKVVKEIANTIQLRNVETLHARVENLNENFHIAVSRAVTDIPTLIRWIKGKMTALPDSPPTLIAFKGENATTELSSLNYPYTIYPIAEIFNEEYFLTKILVHVTLG